MVLPPEIIMPDIATTTRSDTTAERAPNHELANAIRALAMDAVEKAKSGHPGMPMGMAEIAVALSTRHLRHDPTHPHWPDRDRFVLSNGHGSMLHVLADFALQDARARAVVIATGSEVTLAAREAFAHE